MKLIVLNKLDNIEAFIKFEDGCRATIGFCGEKGKYMWFAENKVGEFTKNHQYFRYTEIPKNVGIFRIESENAFLVNFVGDKEYIKKNFEKISGIKITDKKAEDKKEIEKKSAYKETDYTLPEDFLAPPETTPETFWDCNKVSFDELFSKNPENTVLSSLIPGSKWVDVTEDNYVLGVISDEDDSPLYICYGFPLPWSEEPPEKLEGYCQWIPRDFSSPHDDGYWVIYINAKTGERVS